MLVDVEASCLAESRMLAVGLEAEADEETGTYREQILNH